MNNKGFTLIEVMVALLLISVGFLGMTKLLFESQKSTQEVQQRSMALNLANDMIARMSANPEGLTQYSKTLSSVQSKPSKLCDQVTNCSSAEMAVFDLWDWSRDLSGSNIKNSSDNDIGGLFSPVACIDVQGSGVTLSIAWRGRYPRTESDNRIQKECGTGDVNFKLNEDNDLRRMLEVTTTMGS